MLKAELEKKYAEEKEKNDNLLAALTQSLYDIVEVEKDRDSVLKVSIHRQRVIEANERTIRQLHNDTDEALLKQDREIARLKVCLKEAEDNYEDQLVELKEQRDVMHKALASFKTTAELTCDALSLDLLP